MPVSHVASLPDKRAKLNVIRSLCKAGFLPKEKSEHETASLTIDRSHAGSLETLIYRHSDLLSEIEGVSANVRSSHSLLRTSDERARSGISMNQGIFLALLHASIHDQGDHSDLLRTDGHPNVVSVDLGEKGARLFSLMIEPASARSRKWLITKMSSDAAVIKNTKARVVCVH